MEHNIDILIALFVIFSFLILGQQFIGAQAQVSPILVNTGHLDFGIVFPGEFLQRFFTVSLTDNTFGNVDYNLTQKIKPLPSAVPPENFPGTISDYCQTHQTDFERCYRDLCPFLTKISDGNDTEIAASVSPGNPVDSWAVSLQTPAIKGLVAQDHNGGIVDISGVYGCDLSIDIKTQGPPCNNTYTYTLNNDFDQGVLTGLEHTTVADQLQVVKGQASTYPIMWVANAGEDTVSKWDTNLNKELARYATWFGAPNSHGAWEGAAPSRTAVDGQGNSYVANRHFDGKSANVIKILANDWIDRNGNGVMDTSIDSDSNGQIVPAEMLPLTDTNFNGIIDPDEIKDERIAWVVTVGSAGALGRSLAIDLNGNIWLGLYSAQQYYKLSSVDGSILSGPINVAPNTPYGALVDKHGILWGASLSNQLLKLDTNTNLFSVITEPSSDYGIALGYDLQNFTQVYLGFGNPYTRYDSNTGTFSSPGAGFYSLGLATDSGGNILAGNASTGGVTKFTANGAVIWNGAAQVNSEARGVVVDSNDDVWVIHVNASKLSKFRGSDGAPLGVFNSGLYPYTYSDATGLGLRSSISIGTWNVVNDSGQAGMIWDKLSWNDSQPANTALEVKVRSSEDQINWSLWEIVTNNIAFSSTPNGRYLEIQATMQILSGDVSPILYDLTVYRQCSGQLAEPVCGNNIKENNEQCDGTDGVTAGFQCTLQCTLEQNGGGVGGGPNATIVSDVNGGGGSGPTNNLTSNQPTGEANGETTSVPSNDLGMGGGAGEVLGESTQRLPATGFNFNEFVILAMILLALIILRVILKRKSTAAA